MTFFGFILTLGCSLVIGLVAYYMGYMTGAEREHIRMMERIERERREDNK